MYEYTLRYDNNEPARFSSYIIKYNVIIISSLQTIRLTFRKDKASFLLK